MGFYSSFKNTFRIIKKEQQQSFNMSYFDETNAYLCDLLSPLSSNAMKNLSISLFTFCLILGLTQQLPNKPKLNVLKIHQVVAILQLP